MIHAGDPRTLKTRQEDHEIKVSLGYTVTLFEINHTKVNECGINLVELMT